MILKKATHEAIKYACMTFHYSKSVPGDPVGYAVFNDANEFCGCVVFGRGSTPNIGKPYGLAVGEIIELVRVALNGKHGKTSEAVSIALRLIRKDAPLAKLVVSYADCDQDHVGTIYQATNWYYTGRVKQDTIAAYMIKGKRTHIRSINSRYGTSSKEMVAKLDPNAVPVYSQGKHKYLYPLRPNMLQLCVSLKKQYPKKAAVV